MSLTQTIHAKTTVSMTDLRRNPSKIMEIAGDLPVAVLNHTNQTYLLSAKAYETLLERIDDLISSKQLKSAKAAKLSR